jgi:SAM-dependent methyltransferase
MSVGQLRELQVMSLAVNYHRWTYDVVQPYLGARVLEVGGGFGSFTELLLGRDRVVSIDNDPACTSQLRARFGADSRVRIVDADLVDPDLPSRLAGEQLDTAICINVLEHIDEDVGALRNLHRVLEPGGRLVLLVPAHPTLYGTLDAVVGHVRRYDRGRLLAAVRAAGFEPCACRYFNSVGAVGRYVLGRVRRQQETGEGQVRFYDRWVVPLLAPLERAIPPPFGQSLVVMGDKV